MIRKLKAALRLILCTNYILIVDDKDTGYVNFDVKMSTFETRRKSMFLYNYYTEVEMAVDAAQEIINQKGP
jgi:hypothetical protein